MIPNSSIDPAQQEKLLLQFDTALSGPGDFIEKLNALYKSQLQLVEQHGRDGLALLLDHETRVYEDGGVKRSLVIHHYSEAPEQCPWHHLSALPLNEAITKAWELFPIDFVDSLTGHCKDLFVIWEKKKWYLAYAYLVTEYDGSQHFGFLAGSEPEPDAQLPAILLEAGWVMPDNLKALYSVHGSFGDISPVLRGHSECITTAKNLKLSLSNLEKKAEEWDVDYSFHDLLPFYHDGGGNCQNFYKPEYVEDVYLTVDWDHETKELSGWQDLEDFIDYKFGGPLRGEV